jgi:DHA1 family bicyclomycin/chloramphenicol resistance-like MFS transporter
MDVHPPTAGHGGRIFIFGFLSAIAPLSIDIYLPALPMLRQALAADEAQTLFTLSAFFIGFAGGQLVFGPLSDRFGRKPLLLVGLVVYVAASIACALATSMTTIVFWRFVQAFGGSVVPAVVQAMVRDLYDRDQSARILSLNMLVTASAPVIAPLIGGQVLLWFDWRAIFWVLVVFGVVSLGAALALPETLAASRRNKAHPVAMLLGYFKFFRSIRYIGYVACSTFYFCCLFAFIAGSPFVYIDYFNIPPHNGRPPDKVGVYIAKVAQQQDVPAYFREKAALARQPRSRELWHQLLEMATADDGAAEFIIWEGCKLSNKTLRFPPISAA